MKKIILMILLVTGFATLTKAQDTTKVKKTPAERAAHQSKMMQKKLNLTADQSSQITGILTDKATKLDDGKMQGVKGNRLAKMNIMTDADNKINAVLNPDQQKMFAQMQMDAKARKMASHHLHQSAPITAGPPVPVTPAVQ